MAWLSTTHPPWYWLVIVTVRLWLQAGFYMILFLAGLQRIPRTLYEAAAVDGARPGWQIFRYITFPQLRATSVAVVLLLVINAFQAFDEFYNLLSDGRGYPPYARPPLVYLYYMALGQGQNLGLGSAGAVILALIIAIVTVVQARWFGLGRKEALMPRGTEPALEAALATADGRRDCAWSVLIALAAALPGPVLPAGAQRAGDRAATSPRRGWTFFPSHACTGATSRELFDDPSVPMLHALLELRLDRGR